MITRRVSKSGFHLGVTTLLPQPPSTARHLSNVQTVARDLASNMRAIRFVRISCSKTLTQPIISSFATPVATLMRVAFPTVLRLSFSVRNVYHRPPFKTGRPQYAAVEPVSGPRECRNWIYCGHLLSSIDSPVWPGERVSELNPKKTSGCSLALRRSKHFLSLLSAEAEAYPLKSGMLWLRCNVDGQVGRTVQSPRGAQEEECHEP